MFVQCMSQNVIDRNVIFNFSIIVEWIMGAQVPLRLTKFWFPQILDFSSWLNKLQVAQMSQILADWVSFLEQLQG